jgi:hypothetical protein
MVMLEGYRVSKTQQLEDLSSGLGEALGATASQVWVENPSSSLFRFSKLEQAQRGTFEPGSKGGQFIEPKTGIVLDKTDADRRVKDAGVPLTIGAQGIREEALNILISRKRDELKRKAVIDSAPAGFWSGAAQIGTGLAVSIADPINIASAFVPVIGQARYAKLVAGASSAAGRASVRAGVGVTEGVVGAALVEPLVLITAEAEQADYGLYDSFLNLAFGAVLGGGLHAGLGAVGDAIGRSSPQTKETMLKGAIGQALDDRPIDVGYLAQSDPSFRAEWRANQVARAIAGAEVDPRVAREFNQVFDELKPELVTQAAKLDPETQVRVLTDLEAGRVPDVFINDVAKTLQGRLVDFEANAPKIDAQSKEASTADSFDAEQRLAEAPADLDVAVVDTSTDDILTALDDLGEDTAAVRTEIDDINQSAEREGNGLREATMCLLGR